MTRSDLISAIALRFPQLQQADVEIAVKTIMDAMIATLRHKGRIEIRGFGTFSMKHHPSRIGRNPKTGDRVNIPAKYAPYFKVGKHLMQRLVSDTSIIGTFEKP